MSLNRLPKAVPYS